MAYSGVLGLISLGGTILSGNVVSTAVNGFSFVSNAYSGEQYYKNYKKCKDILKQLKKKLERAKQLREEINQFIEKFVSILKAKKFSQ
jgi:cell shape-determining protein MreC